MSNDVNLSASEVAVLLGRTQKEILEFVEAGELAGPVANRRRFVSKQSVVAYVARIAEAVAAFEPTGARP